MSPRFARKAPAMRDVKVRPYRRGDLQSCRSLWHELTIKHREVYSDPTIGGHRPGLFFDDHLKRVGPKRIWVAEEGGSVVGFVGLIIEGEDAEIEPLVVTTSRRGCGIGEVLAKEAIAAAKKTKGVKFLTVRPVARNKEAIAFFRKLGLENIGRMELFCDLAGRKWKKGLRIHGMEFRY